MQSLLSRKRNKMDAFERCEAKIDEANRILGNKIDRNISLIHRSTRQTMITTWLALFFLPAATFIGLMWWIRFSH